MNRKTESELLFEQFCAQGNLDWHPIPIDDDKTCDYRLFFGESTVLFEIKEIESQKGFTPGGRMTRTVGSHVRHKITKARHQMKAAGEAALPAVLLVYNRFDPAQAFGTEIHDFISAMYGELTVSIVNKRVHHSYHGRNAKLRKDENIYLSGVGHLKRLSSGASVRIFENVYAEHPLPFELIPPCIEVVHFEVENAA